ncbi:MarR family winged helix-turn-helix transcriptional regulator [Clostridium arbusti]|uniref:MarR family winged helix-turn-helix transcriptional regulator n=1 Tax=Clostridium arbusti TaxID=1137848 RepID=UPI00028938F3|nr:MarR family transcriptional regulator [Clostridium arbusti]
MDKTLTVMNELMVDIFNGILTIEQTALKEGSFKDISVTEMHTIEAIGMYVPKTMSKVALDLGITVGTLTTAISNLVKKGYVERKRSEEDRRVVKIALTRKGKLAYRIHAKFHRDMIRETLKGMSSKEEEVLINALEKINYFFRNKYKIEVRTNEE